MVSKAISAKLHFNCIINIIAAMDRKVRLVVSVYVSGAGRYRADIQIVRGVVWANKGSVARRGGSNWGEQEPEMVEAKHRVVGTREIPPYQGVK